MDVLERPIQAPPGVIPLAPPVEIDERAARRSLREQVAKLERDLGAAVCAAYPRIELTSFATGRAGPRLLSLGELEALRDELAERLSQVRTDVARQADQQASKRLLIEHMLLEPARYKWVRVTNADIGEAGCKSWHVRPRLGLVGMLAGWWHVKISSGCPLAAGVAPPSHEMGKRSRKRSGVTTTPEERAEVPPRPPPAPSRVDRFIDRQDQRPKAPWHPFPLVELCVLAGVVLIVLGIINNNSDNGRLLLLFGLVLASLAGLDTAVREHFAGFRSHSTLLAGLPAVLTAGTLFFTKAPWPLLIVLALGVFVGGFAYFRALFRRRSGGVAFRA